VQQQHNFTVGRAFIQVVNSVTANVQIVGLEIVAWEVLKATVWSS